MKVLNLSHHTGALLNMEALLKTTRCSVDSVYMYGKASYRINEAEAETLWEENKIVWNSYDLIVTGDSISLAYIFLRKIDEMKPKLLVWIMNRFDYNMNTVPDFYSLFNDRLTNEKYVNKVKFVPYTEYERLYAAKRGVYLKEPVLLPYGKKLSIIPNPTYGAPDFSGMTKGPEETVFIMYYGNDTVFMPLVHLLKNANISVATDQFDSVDEIKKYKCIVHLPDAYSKFCALEFLVNEIPVFIPSERFFQELNRMGRSMPNGQIETYKFTVDGNIVPQEHVPYCEWYRYHMSKVYFDSMEELVKKLKEFTPEKREKLLQQQRLDSEYHMNSVKLTFNKILDDLFM